MVAWFVCPPTTVEQMLSARALAALVGACAALWLASTPLGVSGHGMLKVPAARSSCQSCNNYCPHCMNAGGTGMVSSHSSGVWPAVETDATSVGLEVLAVFFLGPSHYPPPPTTRAPNPHAYHAPRPSYVVCHIQNFFPCTLSLAGVSPPPLSLPGNQVRHGLCGDSVESSQPYLTPGPVVATLPAGSVLQTTVVITAHHKGHIEMWLCPDGDAPLTQSCLNQYSLAVVPVTEADGSTTPTDPAYPGACCRPLHPRTRLQQLWLRVRNELHVCSCVRGGGGGEAWSGF